MNCDAKMQCTDLKVPLPPSTLVDARRNRRYALTRIPREQAFQPATTPQTPKPVFQELDAELGSISNCIKETMATIRFLVDAQLDEVSYNKAPSPTTVVDFKPVQGVPSRPVTDIPMIHRHPMSAKNISPDRVARIKFLPLYTSQNAKTNFAHHWNRKGRALRRAQRDSFPKSSQMVSPVAPAKGQLYITDTPH